MESELNAQSPTKLSSFLNFGHIKGGLEDMRTYSEEAVTAAAYDSEVETILRPVVVSDDPEMDVADLRYLQSYLQEEYGLHGDDLTRAIYRCALNIKRQEGIKKVID